MLSLRSHGIATLLCFGLIRTVGCSSDDKSTGPSGTAGTNASGGGGATGGTAGAAAGRSGAAGAAGDNRAGGASGMSFDSPAGAGGAIFDAPVSYPCENPSLAAGQAGEGGESGASLSCVVGQAFCYVFAGRPVSPTASTVYTPECRSFSENAATDCATTPTCDCLCTHFACHTECRCEEVNGLPTVTCQQI